MSGVQADQHDLDANNGNTREHARPRCRCDTKTDSRLLFSAFASFLVQIVLAIVAPVVAIFCPPVHIRIQERYGGNPINPEAKGPGLFVTLHSCAWDFLSENDKPIMEPEKPLTAPEADFIRTGYHAENIPGRLCLRGLILYRDIYGAEHTRDFCHMYDGENGANAEYCMIHNTSD